MHGATKIVNRIQAMPEVFAQEMIFTLANTGDVEQVTTDKNVYFQKLWVYPANGVTAATGVLTPNAAAVYTGKSGPAVSFTPGALTNDGSVAIVYQPAHGLSEGDCVQVTGATPNDYNVSVARIFNVNANGFSYQMSTVPTTEATVLPTVKALQFCPDKLNSGDPPIKFELPLGQKMRLSQVIVSGTAGDGVYLQWT